MGSRLSLVNTLHFEYSRRIVSVEMQYGGNTSWVLNMAWSFGVVIEILGNERLELISELLYQVLL